jgi:hypothetical protein
VVEADGAVVAGTDDQVLVAEAPYQEALEPVLELVSSRRLGAGETGPGRGGWREGEVRVTGPPHVTFHGQLGIRLVRPPPAGC